MPMTINNVTMLDETAGSLLVELEDGSELRVIKSQLVGAKTDLQNIGDVGFVEVSDRFVTARGLG